ncbi:hypothetical protein DFH06DRAFT_686224 [Mycena polygramma]|nr:hypothetical protein DFH06DRAFT_686224 [Mycena polygramma]
MLLFDLAIFALLLFKALRARARHGGYPETAPFTSRTLTSIHWHGFFKKHTNWADSPAFINQCPITPSNLILFSAISRFRESTLTLNGLRRCEKGRCPI